MKLLSLLICCLVFLGLAASPGLAKGKKAKPTSNIVKGISKTAATILTRNTVIALNNANITGNYTTFRDLAAPAFRAQNNAAKLALIFTKIRQRNMNLAPVVLYHPVFTKTPGVTKKGYLSLIGYFPTKPVQINFAFTYQNIGGQWRMIGISLNPTTVTAQKITKTKKSKKSRRKKKK